MVIEVRQTALIHELKTQIESAGANREVVIGRGTASRPVTWDGVTQVRSVNLDGFALVERLETSDFYVVAQPGLRLSELHRLLSSKSLKFPFLKADANGTVGGMAASGQIFDGTGWYDISRWVLSVEVLLADGSVSRTGAVTYKSVAGYDLPRLFCGSFGTLGIFTEIGLRLYPESASPFGKNLLPVRQRIPKLAPFPEAPLPSSAAGKIAFKLKQALDPSGIFPMLVGWNEI